MRSSLPSMRTNRAPLALRGRRIDLGTARRWAAGGPVAGALLLAVIVLAPSAAASNFTLQYNPPYAATYQPTFTQHATGCNSTAVFNSPAKVNPHSGHVSIGMTATSDGCHTQSQSSVADLDNTLGFGYWGFVANASGTPTIHFRWMTSWSYSITVVPGSVGNSTLGLAQGVLYGELFDMTNQSLGHTFHTTQLFATSTWGGSVAANGSGIVTIAFKANGLRSIQSGHHYVFYSWVEVRAQTYAADGGTASSSVQIGAASVPGTPTILLGVSVY